MEIGPMIDDLPIKNGDVPQLCRIPKRFAIQQPGAHVDHVDLNPGSSWVILNHPEYLGVVVKNTLVGGFNPSEKI